ncbi:hypothetical protein [Chitinophaga vietnamensis]|uniref:hypothetical protein n=1 Tax=Chitinophaga vietnamensis TaxID=2593957 RepID=UPI0011783DEE|nr:hypothetical protein [Chitinophaga vietnamensis]
MIAYASTDLDNLEIRQAADLALRQQCTTPEEQAAVREKFPVNFYTPNPVIRIGLILLTLLIVLVALGLVALMTWHTSDDTIIRTTVIIFSFGCYAALEGFVRTRHFYRAGVDDALLWSSMFLLGAAIIVNTRMPESAACLIALALCLYATLRFADVLAAAGALLSLLLMFFFLLSGEGKLVTPVVLALISIGAYVLARWLGKQEQFRYYRLCCTVWEVLSLLTLYAALNYYVINEVGRNIYQLDEKQTGSNLQLFWFTTVLIPLVYIFFGVRKKDAILLRCGLLLLAAIIGTIRYYHAVMPLEVAMVLAGIVMIGISWGLLRYLRTPRHGFTYQAPDDPAMLDKLNAESLLIAQTMVPAPPAKPGFQFGEGTGSGGGASGDY